MRNTLKLNAEASNRSNCDAFRSGQSENLKKTCKQPKATQFRAREKDTGNVFRLQTEVDLQYVRYEEKGCSVPYRDSVCALCEKTVSLALSIPLRSIQAKTRSSAEVALARQIAMYLSHTMFSILLTEVGLYFRRDRTTVSYACALIEDKRDDLTFDLMISQLESLLTDARQAMSICVETEPRTGKRLSAADEQPRAARSETSLNLPRGEI